MKSFILLIGLVGLASLFSSCGTGNYYQPYPPQKPGHPDIGVQPYPITNHPGCDLQPPVHGDCGA